MSAEKLSEKIGKQNRSEQFFNFLRTVPKSLNPRAYSELSNRKIGDGLSYFLSLLVICFFITIIVFVIIIGNIPQEFSKNLDKFEKLEIKPDIAIKEPIIYGTQKIVFIENKSYEGENLLITKDGIYMKPLSCLLIPPICLFNKKPDVITYSDEGDLLKNKEKTSSIVFWGLLLMLPGLMIVLLFYFFLKYLILALLLSFFVFLITKLTQFKIKFRQIFLISIYTLTIYILIEILSLPFMSLDLFAFVLYLIYFIICVVIVGERKTIVNDEKGH